ncbi:hypothetical protein GGS26DRAFT_581507 [Hypomontagnella submonticulosa]|nr:hypothetical protein GGS26DRAFT_581507 [Hypomontagnella submonticulosa]
MSFYRDAADGTLTSESLDGYLQNHNINDPSTESGNGTKGLTALALAARNGHIDVVRLLLDKGAEVDGRSTQNRTPLWVMTTRSRGGNRAEIVELLLEHKAAVKHSDPKLQGGSTPLENELRLEKDPKVVRILVQNGGITDAAKDLASGLNRPEIDDAMELNQETSNLRETFATIISALILFILAWANIAGRVFNIFQISGSNDDNLARMIEAGGPEPTKDEFRASIMKYVNDNKLNKFFDKDSDEFFDKIIDKAVDLRNDDDTILGEGNNTDRLLKFTLYQSIIYCDDSGSMAPTFNAQKEDRIVDQRNLVQRISSICTKIVPDDLGVHLRFINHELDDCNDLKMEKIQEIMEKVNPNGPTELGTHLHERILEPLLYTQYSDTVQNLKRPLFISIITDGVPKGPDGSPEEPDTLKKEIKRCQQYLLEKGLPPRSVVFQISQIGSDPDSKDFLQKLKADNMENVYITSQQLDSKYRDLKDNERDLEAWLFETLVEPIVGVDSS